MRLPKPITSIILPFVQSRLAGIGAVALAACILFLVAHTFRLAMFDNLLFDSSATIGSCLQHHTGIINKFIVVSFLFALLAVWKLPVTFIVFYVLQTLYMFVNISYHYYFEGYLHINQYFGMFSEAFDLLKHHALPSGPFQWFLFLDLPFFIGCIVYYRKISETIRRRVFKKPLYYFAAIVICAVSAWDPLNGEMSALGIMNDAYSSDSHVVKKYGLFAFNFVDLLNYKDSRSRVERIRYGREWVLPEKDTVRPNFILIQLESIDANIVNYRHRGKFVTPFLNSLAKQCVFYPYTLSFHKAGSTSDCEFSVLSSIEPFDDFPSIKIRNYDYPNSMLKPLVKAGYDAIAFHGNRGTYFNRQIALKKMGFGTFYDMFGMGLEEKAWGAADGEVFDFVRDKLKDQKRPFCYYIISMSSHEPFTLMESYFTTTAYDDVKDELLKRFLTAMTYTDGELGRFVNYLRKNLTNTYIIIYGDHTPAIPKNVYNKASFTDDARLFEFVPCYVITPEGIVARETVQAASFLDIAPTVLHAAKVGCTYKSNGIDLLARIKDPFNIEYIGKTYPRSRLFSMMKTNR